jgi:hypothetical protein
MKHCIAKKLRRLKGEDDVKRSISVDITKTFGHVERSIYVFPLFRWSFWTILYGDCKRDACRQISTRRHTQVVVELFIYSYIYVYI